MCNISIWWVVGLAIHWRCGLFCLWLSPGCSVLVVVSEDENKIIMPFKKTKEGWEYDPEEKNRIPTKPGLYDQEIPPIRNKYGWPMKTFDEVDWERLSKETEERNQDD